MSVMTYRDYAALRDDGTRYELYDGELIEVPSPTLRHQRAIGNLYMIIRHHVALHALGEVLLIMNSTRAFCATACGVTPQPQQTGISFA
jgi:hypothetical protein